MGKVLKGVQGKEFLNGRWPGGRGLAKLKRGPQGGGVCCGREDGSHWTDRILGFKCSRRGRRRVWLRRCWQVLATAILMGMRCLSVDNSELAGALSASMISTEDVSALETRNQCRISAIGVIPS
jgi:hypothetical protein